MASQGAQNNTDTDQEMEKKEMACKAPQGHKMTSVQSNPYYCNRCKANAVLPSLTCKVFSGQDKGISCSVPSGLIRD